MIFSVSSDNLSDGDRALVLLELDRLSNNGYEWRDLFTQCTLQNILNTIQFNVVFDEADCTQFLLGSDDDESEQGRPEADEAGNGEEILLPAETEMIAQDQGNVVPKKMLPGVSD